MKYIIIIGDGMADDMKTCPHNKTPLMVAKKPNIDLLASSSRCGMLATLPESMPKGSEIANMTILGYDPQKCYQGRGVLEAASMGIDIKEDDLVLRCNLITIESEKVKNHSAGHISTEEARELITFLNENLGTDAIRFYHGVSYRHILILKGGSKDLDLTPPHDVPGAKTSSVMPRPNSEKARQTADLIIDLVQKSHNILSSHPINLKRIKEGKDPANSIWPWSPGHKPDMENFCKKHKVRGAIISAVDLIKGLGVYAGMDIIKVDGATGLYDTNYEGKADACLKALKTHDFVYVHVEAPDEAGHEGNFNLKVKTIEDLDRRLIGRILKGLDNDIHDTRIAVLPDHPTPVKLRTHTSDPVPFLIHDSREKNKNTIQCFDENINSEGKYSLLKGDEFINLFFSKSP